MPKVKVNWTETVTYEQVFDFDDDCWRETVEMDEVNELLLDAICDRGDLAAAFDSVEEREIDSWEFT